MVSLAVVLKSNSDACSCFLLPPSLRNVGGGFSSTARGPVGLGGPPGFSSGASARARPDVERAGSDGSFGSANGAANGAANPFIRTARKTQPQPQMNPASHQTQAMAPPSANPPPPPGTFMPTASPNVPAPAPMMPHQAGAMNPASHQAQLMAGMPVPHLPAAAPPAAQELQNQTQNAQYRDEAPPPTPRGVTGQTFSVGDDEGDEDEGAEVQIADIRGRMDGDGGGPIRL